MVRAGSRSAPTLALHRDQMNHRIRPSLPMASSYVVGAAMPRSRRHRAEGDVEADGIAVDKTALFIASGARLFRVAKVARAHASG